MHRSTQKILITAVFALAVVFTPKPSYAVPLNFIGSVPNTVNVFHNAFQETLAFFRLDLSSINTYDPDTGVLNFVIEIYSDPNFQSAVGIATANGNLPGSNLNGNTGNIAGHIDFMFDLKDSKLLSFLQSKGLCGDGNIVTDACKERTYYADQYYYQGQNGQWVNSWANDDLRLWGGGLSYLGVDLHFRTAVPEPATVLLFGTGLLGGGFGFIRRRKIG